MKSGVAIKSRVEFLGLKNEKWCWNQKCSWVFEVEK